MRRRRVSLYKSLLFSFIFFTQARTQSDFSFTIPYLYNGLGFGGLPEYAACTENIDSTGEQRARKLQPTTNLTAAPSANPSLSPTASPTSLCRFGRVLVGSLFSSSPPGGRPSTTEACRRKRSCATPGNCELHTQHRIQDMALAAVTTEKKTDFEWRSQYMLLTLTRTM